MTPKKISELTEFGSYELDNFPQSSYVPAIVNVGGVTSNRKFNLYDFIQKLKNYFGEGSSSGSSGSSTPTSQDLSQINSQLSSLQSQINSITSTISTVSNASNYPTHVIIVEDQEGNQISYNLPTGPNSQSSRVTIKTSELESPLFRLRVATVGLSKNDNRISVSVYAEANATSSNCTGGQVKEVKVSGTYTSPTTSGSFTETTIISPTTVAAGGNQYNSIQLTADLSQPIDQAVVQLSIKYNEQSLGIKVTASLIGNSYNDGSAFTYIFE